MSKPKDFRVWKYDEAYALALQFIVDGETVPICNGKEKILPSIDADAVIYDYGDRFEVFRNADDHDPVTIYYDEGETAANMPFADNAASRRISELVHDIGECKAILDILGEPITGNTVDIAVHNFIGKMKAMYEKELTEATGLPIEKFNI